MATHNLPLGSVNKLNGRVMDCSVTRIEVEMEDQPMECLSPSDPCFKSVYKPDDELFYMSMPPSNYTTPCGVTVNADYGLKLTTFSLFLH